MVVFKYFFFHEELQDISIIKIILIQEINTDSLELHFKH